MPKSCPQQLTKPTTKCTAERYELLVKEIGAKTLRFINDKCDVCPVPGKECDDENKPDFCALIEDTEKPDLLRIQASCPQNQPVQCTDTTNYTKNYNGECCPLKGKEGNSVYAGKYMTKDGTLIYKNIPVGCPSL